MCDVIDSMYKLYSLWSEHSSGGNTSLLTIDCLGEMIYIPEMHGSKVFMHYKVYET